MWVGPLYEGLGGEAQCLQPPSGTEPLFFPQGRDAVREVEALMERMQLLRDSQREEEGVTQEEMATRFEMEKTESLLVAPSGRRGSLQGTLAPLLGCGRPHAGAHSCTLQMSRSMPCSLVCCASWRTPSLATRTSRGAASRRPPPSVLR